MSKNKLRDKIIQNSKLTIAEMMTDSSVFANQPIIPTPVPMINIALSASPSGGLQPGLLQIAGESKHFKTAFGLLIVSSFLKMNDEGIVIFYDSEFGTNETYFKMFEIDTDRIVHCPVVNIEELKHDLSSQLKDLTKNDKVMVFIDSLGNLASLKEATDAEEGKNVSDMTRAKQIKSLFRIVGPHLTLKGIPMVVINHVYKELGLYPKNIVSGGSGAYLNANDIWIIGRQQEKDSDKKLTGWNFTINIEKSRKVKEKTQINISVSYDGGINKYSGIFENAVEAGLITNPKKGRYEYNGVNDFRSGIEDDVEVMKAILNDEKFLTFIYKKYALGSGSV